MLHNHKPFAEKFRPVKLSDLMGQDHLIGKNSFLRNAILNDKIPSMILWGPPGSGKTSLASIIAKKTKSRFIKFSASTAGIPKLRKMIKQAREYLRFNEKTIIFIDEIHRFNKKQQDILLPYVENGTITLIGATTENPSFEVNPALLSRTRIFVLNKLKKSHIILVLKKIKKELKINKISQDLIKLIASYSNNDVRTAINTLEIIINTDKKPTKELVAQIFQKSYLRYDKNGEEHYNIISALIKSMRGGDANASLYWMARMIEAGEEPLYIARRLIRFASEDIGIANNSALMLANSTYQACHFLGYPECDVNLAQCVVYLAKSQKDIGVYEGMKKARSDVKEYGNLEVPLHLRNAPTKLMKDLNYGKDYKYTPKDSSYQNFLPKELKNKKYIK